ncbi:hypothetical protein PanWU01x14_348370, partial [Parasponia andersonii]
IPCSAYPTVMLDHSSTLASTPVTTQREPVRTGLIAPVVTPIALDVSEPGEKDSTQGEHVPPVTQREQPQDSVAIPSLVEGTKTSCLSID